MLHVRTKEVIEGLSEDDALQIVEHKWISPLVRDLDAISLAIVMDVISKMDYLSSKYSTTMHDIQSEKEEVKNSLADMVGMLKAKGLSTRQTDLPLRQSITMRCIRKMRSTSLLNPMRLYLRSLRSTEETNSEALRS